MKKYRFLIIAVVLMISFFMGVKEVNALEKCNFNNYGTLEYRHQKEVNFFDANHQGTDARKISNDRVLTYKESDGKEYYGYDSFSRDDREFYYVYAWNDGYIFSAGFTIYTLDGAQCYHDVNVEKYCKEKEGEHCEAFKFWFKFNKNFVKNINFYGTYYDKDAKTVLEFEKKDVWVRKDGSMLYTAKNDYEIVGKHIDSGDEKKNQGTGTAGVAKATNSKTVSNTKTDKDGNVIYNFETDKKTNCSTIRNIIHDYWKYVMVAVPVLLIVLMSVDFFKAMASNDSDAIKKSVTNIVKRVVSAVILLALPALLSFILGLFGLDLCI